jgi:predicted Zn finger-like uncharacterized protein
MQATCSHCGTLHALDDEQVGEHARVRFRCSNCGQISVAGVARQTERTQAITPLPSFARSEGTAGPGNNMVSEYQGLSLPAGKSVTLTIIAGPAKGLPPYPMSKPRVVLGRSGADIEINDPEVSRWHCAVEVKGDVVRLRDLDSTNGTYFEEERVRAAELQHLSEFRIGSTVVRLTITPKQSG